MREAVGGGGGKKGGWGGKGVYFSVLNLLLLLHVELGASGWLGARGPLPLNAVPKGPAWSGGGRGCNPHRAGEETLGS